MLSKNLVVYLFTRYDNEKTLDRFVSNYLSKPSGAAHELLICFKLIIFWVKTRYCFSYSPTKTISGCIFNYSCSNLSF